MMGQVSRSTLKTYFETKDKPTEAQFEDLIDSLLNIIDDQDKILPDANVSDADKIRRIKSDGSGWENAYQNIESVNAKNFGATGDGTTDDITAINNALDALPSNGGKVILPPGAYRITSGVILGEGQVLQGDSTSWNKSPTKIIKDGNFAGVTLSGGGAYLKDILVQGASGNGGDGVWMKTGRCLISNVSADNHGNDGIRIGGNTDNGDNLNLFYAEHIFATQNGRHGCYVNDDGAGLPDVNSGTINCADLRGNGSDGLRIGNAKQNRFMGISAQANSGHGFYLTSDAIGNQIISPYEENSTVDGAVIENGAVNNIFYLNITSLNGNFVTNNGDDSNVVVAWGADVGGLGTYLHHYSREGFKEIVIVNKDISGGWRINQDGSNRQLLMELAGTTANANVRMKSGSTGVISLLVDGLRFMDASVGLKDANGNIILKNRQSSIGKITDNSGGATDGTLSAVLGSGDDATINNNMAELNSKLDAIIDALGISNGHGLTSD